MPRSASSPFSYSVPAGTVAVSGQVISSTAYNGFLTDITNTVFNAAWPITYGGTGTTDGSALVPDGSASAPGVRFQSETNTGWYRSGAGEMDASILGSKVVAVTASGIAITGTISATGTAIASTALSNDPFYNLSLSASVAASALTIAIKGADGNDPSSTNPVIINFRSATATSGLTSQLTLTSATSLVISSGSTMGFTNAVIGRLWIVGFNDAGTFRLGAVNCLNGTSVFALRDGIYSSTAEGGSGGADSAQVIYTGTAVTSKAMTILGYLEATEATAGTWDTAPSALQIKTASTALPGDVVQVASTQTGATASGTTVLPFDDTIPQNTEGDQYMSQAITPRSGANLLRIDSLLFLSSGASSPWLTAALFQDSTANALAAQSSFLNALNGGLTVSILYSLRSSTTSSTTFKIRAGTQSAGTTTFNGDNVGRKFGGVMNSYLIVQEVVA